MGLDAFTIFVRTIALAIVLAIVLTLFRPLSQIELLLARWKARLAKKGDFKTCYQIDQTWLRFLILCNSSVERKLACCGHLSSFLLPQARFEEAEQVARQALDMVSDGRNALQYAGAQARLARILCYRGELREAEEKTRAALSILQRRYDEDKDKTVDVKIEGKTVPYPIGMLRDRYHLSLIDAVSARAYLLTCLRKYNEALPLLELEGSLRMAAAATSVAAGKIGELYAKLGDFDQAAKLIQQNIDYSKTVSRDSPVFSYAPLRRMAVLMLNKGELDSAEDYFNQSLAQYLRLTQGNQVDRWEMLSGLAEVKLRQDKLEEAREFCLQTEQFAKIHSPKFPELLDYYRVYAETLTKLGRPGDAKHWQDLADEIERRIADAIRS